MVSKKKGALIGRAAGEPYRPLKKLGQVCDLTRDEARRIAAKVAKLAHHKNMTLRQAASELGLVKPEDFDKYVRPEKMVSPG